MKRKITILLFFLLLSIGSTSFMDADASTPAVYDAEEIYERSEGAIFYLRVLQNDGAVKATGTGVMLSPDGTAATAYHVVKDAEQLEAVLHDGRAVRPIEVVNYDEVKDIAVVKLPAPKAGKNGREGESYDSLPIRDTAVKHGEKIYAMGYPLKNTPIITEGIVNSPKAEINGRDRILVSAQVASGMSGGPVVDKHGRLTGIISGSMKTMNNIHLVIDARDLRSLMSSDKDMNRE